MILILGISLNRTLLRNKGTIQKKNFWVASESVWPTFYLSALLWSVMAELCICIKSTCQKSELASWTVHHSWCNLTPLSNICEAVPMYLFWTLNGLNEILEMPFEFPFNLIGKSTMALLTGKSWYNTQILLLRWQPRTRISALFCRRTYTVKFNSICAAGCWTGH